MQSAIIGRKCTRLNLSRIFVNNLSNEKVLPISSNFRHMEGVFAEYLPRLVASWNPQCSAVNRIVIQQLGQQIATLEEDLCRFGKVLKSDHEAKIALASRDKEIDALRESMVRLEKVLLKANDRIMELERQNERLTILQHSDRQVIKQLGSKLKLKPRNLPKEISPSDWDPNDTTIALEKLVLAKNYEALKRRFDEANKVHMMAVDKMNYSHQLALKEKTTDIEELRKRNLDLQKRLDDTKTGALEKRMLQVQNLQQNFARTVSSRVDPTKKGKGGPRDMQHQELVKIVDSMDKENKEKDKQLEESKKKMYEQVQYFKHKLKQLRQRKKREEEGLRNHVLLLEDQIRKLRIQASKSNSTEGTSTED